MELLVFLGIFGLLVLIELYYYRRHAMDELDLDVHFSQSIAQFGETIEVIEIAQNSKKLPLPFLILKFETPISLEFQDMTNTSISDLLYREDMLTMKAYSRHTRRIKAKCTHRGFFSFARVLISTSDLFLIEKITKEYPNEASITVLPERVSSDHLKTLMSITFSDIVQRRTLLTDPFSFAGIREYQPWDPMRTINWTATAKAGDFMVNQTTSTSTRKVSIFVNLEFYNTKHSDSLLEKAISLAYSYMCELSESGIPSAIFTNGRDITSGTLITSNSSSTVDNITRRAIELARIDLTQEVLPFYELVDQYSSSIGQDDFILVISPKCDQELMSIIMNLKSKKTSLLWVRPCYRGATAPKTKIDSTLASNYMEWELLGHD